MIRALSHRLNGALLAGLVVISFAFGHSPVRKGDSLKVLDILHEAAWEQCKSEGAKRVTAMLR